MSTKGKKQSNPIQIDNIEIFDNEYRFTLSNIPTPYANGLRRTIITDIPINVLSLTFENNC